MEVMSLKKDLSSYTNVFCDSQEALIWAYQNGLSPKALIRTSSPAMLWSKNKYISDIESHWSEEKMHKFQSTIKKFSEEIFDKLISTKCLTHEEALCISSTAVFFHKVIFKAACLKDEDLREPRLFISVDGFGGLGGNNMNSPWDLLLNHNSKFKKIVYSLDRLKWDGLSTDGISLFNRIKIGGIETLIYRIFVKLMSNLPNSFFRKQVLVVNESELLIETGAALILNGIKIRKIVPDNSDFIPDNSHQLLIIKESIKTIVRNRIKEWVSPDLVKSCELLFFQEIEAKFNTFSQLRSKWSFLSKEPSKYKRVLLINAPGNISGLAISSMCRKIGIPIVSTQHGITMEICETSGGGSLANEINVSDIFLTYNSESKKISENSHFAIGNAIDVGISARHLRMKNPPFLGNNNNFAPIVYVSTNLYRGNLSAIGNCLTDYKKAKKEGRLINKVLNELPHKVCYKTYPEENRRYADEDPIISLINSKKNMELFDRKIDMRFLIQKHQVLVTSLATSTIGWLVMSKKPVVFINCHSESPLTKNAYDQFSKGLFVFNETDDLYGKLQHFLSRPIAEIEKLGLQKENDRNALISKFFTSSQKGNAGKLASQIIIKKYFTK